MSSRGTVMTMKSDAVTREVEPCFIPASSRDNSLVARLAKRAHREPLALLGAATASGVLWFIACPDFDLWPLAWVAMAPALFAIERASTLRRAITLSWWAGFVGNAGGFYWVIGLLERFGDMPMAAAAALFVLLCSYQALRFLLFGLLFRTIRNRTNLPASLLAPAAMVTAELCLPFVFPYYLGFTQASQPAVIQIADLTGPLGVTALLLMINGALYDLAAGGARRPAAAAVSACILLAALGYGHLRIRQFADLRAISPKVKVGVVQPNVAAYSDGGLAGGTASERLADLQKQSARLEADGAELIVWTETIYPSIISRQTPGDWHETHPLRIRRGFTTPLIFGAMTGDGRADGGAYNSALLLDRAGNFSSRYDKNNLLMFGEYVPWLDKFPSLREYLPRAAGRYKPGSGVSEITFQTADGRAWRVGPMICLEDILPSHGRQIAKLRPHLLINITDDSWFGHTSEPSQHLALSVFRSVELRTDMVRAVNPGISAFVDATGRVHAQTLSVDAVGGAGGAESMLAEVALVEGGHTVYAAVGDLFGYISLAVTLYLWLVLPRLRWRKSV